MRRKFDEADDADGHMSNVTHSHKQETSGIVGKMSFWYPCKEHTFGFNLIFFFKVHVPLIF